MKLAAILALVDQEYFLTLLFVVILSCFSAFYYIRILKIMVFTKTAGNLMWLLPISHVTAFIGAFLITLILFTAIYPYPLDVFSTLVSLTLV
jgi:NADH:ubiquinone oxidoreductase subunit 2 (subunit N)